MNLTEILIKQAKLLNNKIAIYYPKGTMTYNELNIAVWKTAQYFINNGIKKDEIVTLIFEDELSLFISFLAISRIGATVFNISNNSTNYEKENLINSVESTIIISDYMNDFEKKYLLINFHLFNILESNIIIDETIFNKVPKKPFLLAYGSGTTGKNKILPITHKQQIKRIELGINWLPYKQTDIFLSMINMNFYAFKLRALEALGIGSSIVFPDRNNIYNDDNYRKATVIYGTAFHMEEIINNSSIKINNQIIMIGGSSVSSNLRKKVCNNLSKNLFILYGCNETSTATIIDNNNLLLDSSVGKVHKNVKIEIVDENDKEKRIGEIGHIRVKSPGMIDGYLNDEEATNKAFKNGWFYPGDLGKFTQDKELIYCGRSDHMMIMNGINIYPAQIENIITSHEAILDAVALPVKHPIHQDIPICAVVLKENKQISKLELLNYSIERLGFSSPKEIVFLDFIPRNEQGKVIRIELNEMILENFKYENK